MQVVTDQNNTALPAMAARCATRTAPDRRIAPPSSADRHSCRSFRTQLPLR